MILPLVLSLAATFSQSAIRDSGHIDLVRIESSAPAPWAPGPRRTRTRSIALTVAIERELKGGIANGTQLSFEIQQSESGPRTVALPGPWSGKNIEPGSRLIVFSNSDPAHATSVEEVSTLPQVEFALEADRQSWRVGDLGRRVPSTALGPVFGEYLLSRLGEVLYKDPAQFDALLSWLEDPGIPTDFRLQIMSQIFSRVISEDSAPQAFWSRLAVSGFRIAALPDAGPLGDSLLSTYLPNLLGLNGGVSRKTPAQVFAGFPQDRKRARETASHSAALVQWFAD